MGNITNIGDPVSFNERVAYEQLIRLDALCNMVSSLVEYIAKKDNVAVETKTVEKREPVKKIEKEETKVEEKEVKEKVTPISKAKATPKKEGGVVVEHGENKGKGKN